MRAKLNSFVSRDEGFSLVELAIVLLIIGLILGGILKGQELLESARLKAVITQINEYRLANSIFYERFGALPGDFNKASDYIHPDLLNGNGNGVIEGPGLSRSGSNHEALSFWSHLAAAQLIASPGAPVQNDNATFGHGAPASKIGGGFTVVYNVFDTNKHWFVLGKENGTAGDGALLTPLQALSLDHKMDSGQPDNGSFRAKNGKGTANKCLKSSYQYNVMNNQPACVVYFAF